MTLQYISCKSYLKRHKSHSPGAGFRRWFLLIPALMLFFASCRDEQISPPNGGKPFISGLEPATGRVGSTISVTGGNFSKNPQENQVFFNGVPAVISVGIDEEVLVTVPAGATSGPVSITVPGFEAVEGPVFTVEEFLKPTIYWLAGSLYKTTFDDAGAAVISTLYTFVDKQVSSFRGFEVDAANQTIYLTENGGYAYGSMVERVNYGIGTLDTLYDKTSSPLLDSVQISRIALDLENEIFYATMYRTLDNGNNTPCIVKGSLDGSTALELIYEGTESSQVMDISLAIGAGSLYWAENIGKRIMRMPLTSGVPEVVYDASDDLLMPKELAIDEATNRLFFTDDPLPQNGEVVDKIMQGSLDGAQPLVTPLEGEEDNVFDPEYGLALDAGNNILYWITKVRNSDNTRRFMQLDLNREELQPDELFEVGQDGGAYPADPTYFTISLEEGDPSGSGRVVSNGKLRARVKK